MLSIKAGKISSALLLRKLGNYSRKNRLYGFVKVLEEQKRYCSRVFLLMMVTRLAGALSRHATS